MTTEPKNELPELLQAIIDEEAGTLGYDGMIMNMKAAATEALAIVTRPAKAVQGDKEIERLASFILKSDLGHPRCSEQKPEGESAVDAAIAIITELRNKSALTPESEGIAGKGDGRARSMQILEVGKDKWGEPLTVMGTPNAIAALARPQEIDVEALKEECADLLVTAHITDDSMFAAARFVIDHLAETGRLSAPQVSREKELMGVIADLSIDLIAARHGLGQKTSQTTAQIKHAEIIEEAYKCKQ